MRVIMTGLKLFVGLACFLLASVSFSNAQEYNYFEQNAPPAGASPQGAPPQQAGSPPPAGNSQQQYYHFQQPSGANTSQPAQKPYRFQQRGTQAYRQYRFQEGTYPTSVIELNANGDTFEGRFASAFSFLPNGFSLGLNGIGSDKDFYSVSLDGVYGTQFTGNLFAFGIGLRGIWGSAEYNDQDDSTLGALGFLMQASYDIQEFQLFRLFIDLDIGGELAGAPGPLCFSDTSGYLDTRFYVDINLMPNKKSAITLGYRYLRMEFEEDNIDWERKDDSAYFGFKFRF